MNILPVCFMFLIQKHAELELFFRERSARFLRYLGVNAKMSSVVTRDCQETSREASENELILRLTFSDTMGSVYEVTTYQEMVHCSESISSSQVQTKAFCCLLRLGNCSETRRR